MKIKNILLYILIILPASTFAISFAGLVDKVFGTFLTSVVNVLIGSAVIFFLYGVLTVIIAEDGKQKEQAKEKMLWGIIAIFVMFSVWGLLKILDDTSDLEKSGQYNYYNKSFNIDTQPTAGQFRIPKTD